MDRELADVLREDYLGDLASISMDEVRERRARCSAVETQFSYLRRLVQGHLDIINGETERRRQGGDPEDVHALVEQLPAILADRIHNPGPGRLADAVAPGELSGELAGRLEAITDRLSASTPADLDEETLAATAADLTVLEQEVSAVRRSLFDRIDALQAELTRRYRDGEAQVDDLLNRDR